MVISAPPAAYRVLISLDIFQVEEHRVLSRIFLVYVAYPMRSKIDLTILLIWKLERAGETPVSVLAGQGIS